MSLFPWSVPVGLAPKGLSIRRLELTLALSSSPFLAPYISLGSWSIALFGLLESPPAMVGVVFGLWLFYGLYSYLH